MYKNWEIFQGNQLKQEYLIINQEDLQHPKGWLGCDMIPYHHQQLVPYKT